MKLENGPVLLMSIWRAMLNNGKTCPRVLWWSSRILTWISVVIMGVLGVSG